MQSTAYISEIVRPSKTEQASVKTSKACRSYDFLSYIHCNAFDRFKGVFTDCDREQVLQQISISAPWKWGMIDEY